MAKTLGTVTAARVARSHLAPVALVRIRCYDNRATGSVARTFYFSTGPGLRYQWSGEASAQNHDPVVASIGALSVSIPHLPSGAEEDIPDKLLSLTLANVDFEGSRLAAVMRGYTLENARVDVAQVLLGTPAAVPFVDVTSEEVVVW